MPRLAGNFFAASIGAFRLRDGDRISDHCHAGLGLLDESDDLFGGEATIAHVRPLGLTDFTASRGTAQRGQVN